MSTNPAPRSSLDTFFDTLRRSSVRRSAAGTIGGVCAGVAERLGVSTTVVRAVAVVLAIFGIGVPLYLLAWLLLPDTQGTLHVERAIRYGGPSSIVLLVVALLVLLPSRGSGTFWIIATLAVIAFFVWRSRQRSSGTSATTTHYPQSPPGWQPPYGQPTPGQPTPGQGPSDPSAGYPPQDAPRG